MLLIFVILALGLQIGFQVNAKANQASTIEKDRGNCIYVGYDNGIWVFNIKNGHYENIRKNKEKVYGPNGNLTRIGNYLYYDQSGPNEKGWWICRYNLDNGKEDRLALGKDPDISGEKIYYTIIDKKSKNQSIDDDEPLKKNGIGSMNLDGSDQRQICSYRSDLFVRNGQVYYFDDYKLYGVDLNGEKSRELASFNNNSNDIEVCDVWSIKNQLYINFIDYTTGSKSDPKAMDYATLSRYNTDTGEVTDLVNYFRYNSGDVVYEIDDVRSNSAVFDAYYGSKDAQKKNKALGELFLYSYKDGKAKSLFKMKDRDYFSFYFMNNRYVIGEMKLKSGKNVLSIYDRKKQAFSDIP